MACESQSEFLQIRSSGLANNLFFHGTRCKHRLSQSTGRAPNCLPLQCLKRCVVLTFLYSNNKLVIWRISRWDICLAQPRRGSFRDMGAHLTSFLQPCSHLAVNCHSLDVVCTHFLCKSNAPILHPISSPQP